MSQEIQSTVVNRKTDKHLSIKRELIESGTNINLMFELNKDKALIQQMLKDYLREDSPIIPTSQKFEVNEWVDFRMQNGCYIGCRVIGYTHIKGKLVISLYEEDIGDFVVPPDTVCEYECG